MLALFRFLARKPKDSRISVQFGTENLPNFTLIRQISKSPAEQLQFAIGYRRLSDR